MKITLSLTSGFITLTVVTNKWYKSFGGKMTKDELLTAILLLIGAVLIFAIGWASHALWIAQQVSY